MKEDIKKGIAYLVLIGIAIIFYHMIDNFQATMTQISSIMSKFSVFATALVIAFLLNIPMVSIEKFLFKKMNEKQVSGKAKKHHKNKKPTDWVKVFFTKIKGKIFSAGGQRSISLLLTLIIVCVFLAIMSVIIAPQLVHSIETLIGQAPGYMKKIGVFIDQLANRWNISEDIMSQIVAIWENTLNKIADLLLGMVDLIYGYISKVVGQVFNFVISMVLALYMLVSKEKLIGVIDKVYRAYFPMKHQRVVKRHFGSLIGSFQQFVRGQLIEAVIIGVMCYVGMRIFRFEYALLISVIIGLTNIIPMFGPYIGGIPSFLLLLTFNPISALWFIVFLMVLQQIEGNLIYPKVVGDSLGIGGFWILTVVIVGNSFFGIPGILLGIPIFSTFYIIFKEVVEKRLKKREEDTVVE